MASSLNKVLLSFAFVVAAAISVFAQAAQPVRTAEYFQNPVFDFDFPDPTVIRARDGFFYAYATQGSVDGKEQRIQVARSADLMNWERLPSALPEAPAWADDKVPNTWAPHVHEADGKYFMYYSADPKTKTGLCLAVAVADSPAGPFKDIGKPLKCGESFINIDPMAYDDPKTGKRLLYWGSGFNPIMVQELAPNRIEFAEGSKLIELVPTIKDDDPNNYQRLVEGVWVTLRDGYYYLFYSGDNCCGEKAHYAVMVARSRSATGPFETLASATGRKNSVILEMNEKWIAPGHNSVIRDDRGVDWLVYHAIDASKRKTPEGGDRRVMLISRIVYRNGWPWAEPSTPGKGRQKAPVLKKRK